MKADITMNHLLPRSIVSLAQRAVVASTTDPADVWTRSIDKIAERREWKRPKCSYASAPNWDERLHRLLRAPFPCKICGEFDALWSGINDTLAKAGIPTGPQSFGPWNDGDAGLVRAAWCLMRHLRAQQVVETGVAHGLTSRVILEAMARNGTGHLSSIDLPPLDEGLRKQVGAAVTPDVARRWTYTRGRAAAAYRACCLGSAGSMSSSTTACTANATCGSNSTGHGAPCAPAARPSSTTSTPTGAFTRSTRPSRAIRTLSAKRSRCVPTRAASMAVGCSGSC
jgi:hypothetical protein